MKGNRRRTTGCATAALVLTVTAGYAVANLPKHFPSPEEQEIMHSEVYFPKAKPDTSAGLLPRIYALAGGRLALEKPERDELEKKLVGEFIDNTYAELPLFKMTVDIDFGARKNGLKVLSQFSTVREDYGLLYAIADYIGKGVPISTAMRHEDAKAIIAVRNHLCHTPEQLEAYERQHGKYRIVGALKTDVTLRGFARECGMEYAARDAYNMRLAEFREEVLKCYCKQITMDHPDEDERRAIWDEFCRRAKATEEERNRLNGHRNHN